jgi:hypothetical protein
VVTVGTVGGVSAALVTGRADGVTIAGAAPFSTGFSAGVVVGASLLFPSDVVSAATPPPRRKMPTAASTSPSGLRRGISGATTGRDEAAGAATGVTETSLVRSASGELDAAVGAPLLRAPATDDSPGTLGARGIGV